MSKVFLAKPKAVAKPKKKEKEVGVKTKVKKEPKVSVVDHSETVNAILQNIYTKKLDSMEKKFSITSMELAIPDRLSTGMLMLDLLVGGGFIAGTMIQISGLEKGGKTTTTLTTLRAAIKAKIPLIIYWDAENALLDPSFAEGIIKYNIKDVFFGKKRKARLYQEANLEDFYNSTKLLMRSLPDKLYKQDTDTWYFVFDSTKVGRSKMAEFGYKSYDKKLFQETGRLWCPTNMRGFQGIVFCDSYPSLVTTDEDESDDQKRDMALNARAFSKNIRKIKGWLKRKGFLVIGVNQIRLNPAARFGSPEYEPGGEALKFHSDVRLQNRPRAVPEPWPKGNKEDGSKTSEFCEEPSIYKKEGRNWTDRYSFVKLKNTKNKTGIPGLESWMRIWFRNHKGKPQGYDPVFDTYQYLKTTSRISGPLKKLKITGFKHLKGKTLNWMQFKLLILAEETQEEDLIKRVRKELGIKQLDLRAKCFEEIANRSAFEMLDTASSGKDDDDEDMESVLNEGDKEE